MLSRSVVSSLHVPLHFREQGKSKETRSGEHGGYDVISVLLLAKNLRTTTLCQQGRYHRAKANFDSYINVGVFGELLRETCA